MSQLLIHLDAESLIRYGGPGLLCLIVFCSAGLFFCFFLPTGSLLFAAGLLTATSDLLPSVFTICLMLTGSSVAGSLAGYGMGRRTGNFFYTRRETRFFRRSYLISTEDFYNKYGSFAMIGGYFLPVIRSFAPVLAGIIRVKFQRFLIFNIIGSAIFTSVFVLAGYLTGNLPFLRPWLKYIVGVFVLVVTVPVVVKIVRTMTRTVER
jgi:membrane-associated protein